MRTDQKDTPLTYTCSVCASCPLWNISKSAYWPEAKAPYSFPSERLAKTTTRSHRLSGHLTQPAKPLVVEVQVHIHEMAVECVSESIQRKQRLIGGLTLRTTA